ncbi:pentapeptide repeat-containing protein [Nannocystis sp.]|uniref:NACHT and WD40 repeat domain-containing protein n=1 Tax=Nannocystis sp. TaxID=1962667 RepID=UPI0025F036E9|nr:pentapeptide repeat-containing protein [Nannocystis sp.]MBK7830478.1 pentapeptide repeat-containing protein [Nannocystis sp.]
MTDRARGVYVLGAHEGPASFELINRWAGDVHDPFRRRGNPGRVSDLVVASHDLLDDRVVARAAEGGITLVRRMDYERVIDTERVKELLRARLDGDLEYAHELYIEQRVRLWSPVDDRTETVHPAVERVASVLCEPEGSFVLVLGAAGTGKTFLLREVARTMMERQSLVTPIVVELRGLDRAQNVVELVAFEFARRRLSLPVRAFERDLHDGRIALLFDGFDELAIRVRPAAIPEHFARIAGAARDRARVLVASRSEHFVTHKAAVEALMCRVSPDVAGLAGQWQAIARRRLVVTEKFSPVEIAEYLGRVLGSKEAGQRRMDRFKKVHDLSGLAATPRMLSFLVRLTDAQLDAAAARRDAITSAELYRLVIVDDWLGHQEEHLNPPGGAPGPTRAVLLDVATRLALHLWRSTVKRIVASELDAHTSEQLRKLCDDDRDVARQMVQSRTLLTHADDGSFEFVHQTVMEWLVAQLIAEELKRAERCAELEVGRLSEFMMDVLCELVGEAGLVAWAKRALSDASGTRLAENARLVLAFMQHEIVELSADVRRQDLRGQSLAGQSFRGALLDGADLRGADLSGRDLRGASLKETRLCHANLRGADLRGARLDNADFSFATLDRATLEGAQLTGASFLAARVLAARGAFDRTAARHTEAAAWSAELAVISILGGEAGCIAVAWSPDGLLLATTHRDGSLWVWDATRGLPLRGFVGHTDVIMSVTWSPDGTRLASGSSDNSVRVWEAASGKALRVMKGHTDGVRSVAWSPDGTLLASGSSDNSVRVWKAASGKSLRAMEGHTGMVIGVAWSPDGTRLASGSSDNSVRVWGGRQRQGPADDGGHTDWVRSVAWSPDGTRLASGSDDNSVRLWEVASGRGLRAMEGTQGGSAAWRGARTGGDSPAGPTITACV